MKTIQMTIDEDLLTSVDNTVTELHTTRSAFIRAALESALRQHKIRGLETRQARGYAETPAREEEVEKWSAEQVWSDL